jgi:hypothetical protein
MKICSVFLWLKKAVLQTDVAKQTDAIFQMFVAKAPKNQRFEDSIEDVYRFCSHR